MTAQERKTQDTLPRPLSGCIANPKRSIPTGYMTGEIKVMERMMSMCTPDPASPFKASCSSRRRRTANKLSYPW
jgi:hypothetical protein